MKKYILFLLFSSLIYSQTNGIAYQAVIVRPNVQTLPGVQVSSSPLINSEICLRFSFSDSSNALEYQEIIKTSTNQYGVVNVTIGKGNQIGGFASSFSSIRWNTTDKNLKVELDITSACSSFELISEQSFSSAPFAFNAITANNVSGVVGISNGGTGASTKLEALTNLSLDQVNNTSDANKPVSTATQTALDAKANLASPTFTGTVSGIDKSMVGLNNVDNTSDLNKPISKETQTALDAKANLASPTFTGTVSGIDKSMVGLNNVDNTSDLNKPISKETQTQLALKEGLANKSIDITTDATSDDKYPTVKAVKSYVDAISSAGVVDASSTVKGKIQLAGDLTGAADAPTIADGVVTNSKIASGIDKAKVGLDQVDNTSDIDKPISAKTQQVLDMKLGTDLLGSSYGIAMLDVDGRIPSTQLPPISFTSVLVLNNETEMLTLVNPSIGTVVIRTDVSKNYILSYPNSTLRDSWVELLSPDAPVQAVNGKTGIVQLTPKDIFLDKIDNTSDIDKPVSILTQVSLNLKEDLTNKSSDISTDGTSNVKYPTVKAIKDYVDQQVSSGVVDASSNIKGKILLAGDLTGTSDAPLIADGAVTNAKIASGIDKLKVGLGNVDNTSDLSKPISTATQTALSSKANLASPTFTGTVSGITKSMIGLGNVDNTSDTNKPVSKATQTALAGKANTDSPTFTGTVSGIDRAMVGLNNVDNTSDLNKPVSTATQTALEAKESLANKSINVALDEASDEKYPSVKAIKSYVDTQISSGVVEASPTVKGKIQLAGDLSGTADAPTIGNGVITNEKIAPGIDKSKVGLANVDNTSDESKPLSIATQTALELKENIANKSIDISTDPTSNDKYPSVKAVRDYVDTKVIENVVDATTVNKGIIKLKGDLTGTADAPMIANGAVSNSKIATGIDKSKVGLDKVDNTSDEYKPISIATQNALNLKLDSNKLGANGGVASLDATGKIPSSQIPSVSFSSVNVVNSELEMLALPNLVVGSIAVRTDLSKNFILSNPDSTILSNWVQFLSPDAPVQTVNAKTGNILLTATDINLGNVDNTSDESKPLSIATQTALELKESIANKSIDISTDPTSNDKYPSVKAVRDYVDTKVIENVVDATTVNKGIIQLKGDLTGTADAPAIANNAITNEKIATGIDKAKVGLGNVDNTSDTSKPISTSTQAALNKKADLNNPEFTGTLKAEYLKGNGSNLTDVVATSAKSATITQEITSDKTYFPVFVSGVKGNLQQNVSDEKNLSFVPKTGALTAKIFIGDGSKLTNISAVDASKIAITDDTTIDKNVYPTFVTDVKGNLSQKIASTKLSFVPKTGTLTATNFIGDGAKLTNVSALDATKIAITNDTIYDKPVYPTFVTETSGNLSQKVASKRLSLVPNTGTLTATNFEGDGSRLTNVGNLSSSIISLEDMDKYQYTIPMLTRHYDDGNLTPFKTNLAVASSEAGPPISVRTAKIGNENYLSLVAPSFTGYGGFLSGISSENIKISAKPIDIKNYEVGDIRYKRLTIPVYSKANGITYSAGDTDLYTTYPFIDLKKQEFEEISYNPQTNSLEAKSFNALGGNIAAINGDILISGLGKFIGNGSGLTSVNAESVKVKSGLLAPGATDFTTGKIYPTFIATNDATKDSQSSIGIRASVFYDSSNRAFNAVKFVGDGSGLTNINSQTSEFVKVSTTKDATYTPLLLQTGTGIIDVTAVKPVYDKSSSIKINPVSGELSAKSFVGDAKKLTGISNNIKFTGTTSVRLFGNATRTLPIINDFYEQIRFKFYSSLDKVSSGFIYINIRESSENINIQVPVSLDDSDSLTFYLISLSYDKDLRTIKVNKMGKKLISGLGIIRYIDLKNDTNVYLTGFESVP
ncbi:MULTISPECIES: hypothetical protein [Flavobacterium]|uniref:Uncharacterized protein n=1 Tax=Flavobacterium keumense TaxID=1306518 RepID=A0ABY8N843_9FLAO|nr:MULTISPECIES: hypothetical protein [Flavobacterium]WGK94751.1 hypothetical protein MG292_00560 [Flavobacterium keumense]